MTSQTPDWADKVMADFPEPPVHLSCATFPTAEEIIKNAAHNRRMAVSDYVGRAALAMAIYDGDGTDTWDSATQNEPPLRDIRRRKLPRRRLRGTGFGPWRITGVDE